MGRPRKYATEEERKEARRASKLKYYQEHKDAHAEYMVRYRQEHKEEITRYCQEHKEERTKYRQEHKDKFAKYNAKYRQTKEGRAYDLIKRYKQNDKKFNRGDCNLTVPWFIENVFNQRCYYCGETDWKKLGADRIDNDLPHTIENVVPCCLDCNNKRQKKTFEQFCREMNVQTTVNFS